MLQLPYYSESGLEVFYGTEDSAGLDLPLWDARLTKRYQIAKEIGLSEEALDVLLASITQEEIAEGEITLEPMGQFTVKTGVYMAIPKGHYGSLDTRSSTSKIRQDLLCHTIDADFRGNIRLAVINLNTVPVTLKNGQSIAQIIIQKYEKVEPIKVNSPEELEVTERGEGGFGSTGRNV